MRSQVPWKLLVVAGLSLGIGWGAARSLYSQNADAKPAAAAASAAAEAATDPLDELAWLAGNWIEEGEAPAVEFACRWTRTGAFLLRAFRVDSGEEGTMAGLQIIGWDPAEKQIRSWTFDENGGIGEEHWSKSGANWSIRSKYTLPDGGKAGAVHLLTKLDEDKFEWKSVNREVDGQMFPDVEPLTIVRSAENTVEPPPAPAGAPGKAAPAPAKR